jgi:hypothetical protein
LFSDIARMAHGNLDNAPPPCSRMNRVRTRPRHSRARNLCQIRVKSGKIGEVRSGLRFGGARPPRAQTDAPRPSPES